MNSMICARVLSYGSCGKILKISNFAVSGNVDETKDKPHVIFLLDRSGSMGPFSSLIANNVIPLALRELDYSLECKVTAITFDSSTERVLFNGNDPPIGQLSSINASSQNGTNMSGVIPVLAQVIGELTPFRSISIVALSDGEIFDQQATLDAAKLFGPIIGARAGIISVNLIRLLTSPFANPDTTALACLGSFSNDSNDNVQIIDIPTSGSDASLTLEDTSSLITKILVNSLKAFTTTRCAKISSPSHSLRRLPSDIPLDNICIRSDRTEFILLDSDADVSQLRYNDMPFIIEDAGQLCNEEDIIEFLRHIEVQIRLWDVMGSKIEDIKSLQDWVLHLKDLIQPTVEALVATTPVLLRDRVKFLRKSIDTQEKSIFNRIAQYGNQQLLSQLNNAQKADFLRGNLKSVGTAKRSAKSFGVDDLDGKCFDAVKRLQTYEPRLPTETDTGVAAGAAADEEYKEASYLSCASFSDIVNAIKNDLSSIPTDFGLSSILQVVGGLGVPIHLLRRDYPDPWDVTVVEVFSGACLAEFDLRYAEANGHTLMCPGRGPEAAINGVLVLKSYHDSDWYDLYRTSSISDMHMSVTMRGAVAPIPYDGLACTAAVFRRLLLQMGHDKRVVEVDYALYTSLRTQLSKAVKSNRIFDDIAIHLSTPDVRAWFTGDVFVSGTLKPLMVLLVSDLCNGVRTVVTALGAVIRSLFWLETYQRTRGHFRDDPTRRQDVLYKLLGIDFDYYFSQCCIGQPFDPEHPFDVSIISSIPSDAYNQISAELAWMPAFDDFTALSRFANRDEHTDDPNIPPMDLSTAFGLESSELNDFLLFVLVECLMCKREEDWVDKEHRTTHTFAAMNCASEMRAFVVAAAVNIYKTEYDERLAVKRREEDLVRRDRLIVSLICTTDYNTFVRDLAGIPNNTSVGVDKLLSVLSDTTREVPLRRQKLWVLLLGRNESGQPVWSNGNVYRGDLAIFADAFVTDAGEDGEHNWGRLLEMHKEFNLHKYRAFGQNRHGHCDAKPSYWARGFVSLSAFQRAVSEEEFQAYATLHNDCCGFA